MPPKKKQEQIDVSTLPPWFSKNAIILCAGSTKRSQSILNQIRTNSNKMVRFIPEAEIIEHAKAKQLYVDITTLTQKQKKQLKPQTPTELTDEVKAKSLTSLLNQLNIANRVERKRKLEALNEPPPDLKKTGAKKESKKEQKQPEPVVQKQYNKAFDSLYVLENYPQKIEDLQQLSKENEAINYVVVIKPELIYPEEDEDEEEEQEQQQKQEGQNQQQQNVEPIKKIKEPKYPKQVLTQQDILHNTSINNFVSLIREGKKTVPVESQLRNCLIKQIKVDINVKEQDLKGIPELIFQNLCQLSLERVNYDEWLKTKTKREFETAEVREEERKIVKQWFNTPLDLLIKVANTVQKVIREPTRTEEEKKQQQYQAIEGLFQQNSEPEQSPVQQNTSVYNQNYWVGNQKKFFKQQKNVLERLMLPGIDRTLMPEIPQKSYQRRRYQQSTYTNFINGQFDDFQRMQAISEFQSLMQADNTKYNFSNRVYQQFHDKKSITDTFVKMFLHDPQILAKYDDKTDSLLVAAFFKNPSARVNYRKWTADWKTLPNFDNWFNYFKNNQNNFKNNSFYNIDDTKLGKITQSVKETSPEDGSIVIQKVQEAADRKQIDLKVIKNDQVFGLKDKNGECQFWYTAFGHRVSATKSNNKFEIIITLICGLILVINEEGHVYQRRKRVSMKTLPTGYTIIYDELKHPSVLHPNGGLTTSSESFSNSQGLGLVYPNTLKEVPTFKRTGSTHSVTRREDETIIIEEKDKKWIKFVDGTTYQLTNNNIQIDKRGFAQANYSDNIRYNYEDVEIVGTLQNQQYTFQINFKDGSKVIVGSSGVRCQSSETETREFGHYLCDFENREILFVGKNNLIFKVQNIEDEKLEDKEYQQRADVNEPRLFLIRNDNSAAEFISEKQLKKYFNDKSSDPYTQIKRTKQNKSELIEIISKIYPRPNVTPIVPEYPANLDVLPVPPPLNAHEPYKISTLRILSKLSPLTSEDRQNFQEAVKKQAEWKAQAIKADNEFGYCQKDSKTLQEQMQFAKKMIERRKQSVQEYPYSQLKDKLLKELVQKVVLEQTNMFDEENEEIQLINKTSMLEKSLHQQNRLESQIQKTPSFVPYFPTRNYFETPQGAFALSQMPKEAFQPSAEYRSNYLDQNSGALMSQSVSQNMHHSNSQNQNNSFQTMTITQSPIYKLQQNQINNNASRRSSSKQIIIKPSVFTQQDIDEQKKAFEQEKKAYKKRALKRKDVDIYGKEREDKPVVASLLRTQPISEINQKYILTESITQQKVKISSMKNRMIMNSSNLAEIRKEGPHHALLKSMDMSNTLEQIHEKRTKMVHSDLKDSLSRDILILPAEANFGVVKQNSMYELKIDVKNQDVMSQRIAIKRPKTNMVKAFLNEMGPIPLGISRKVVVQLRTIPEMNGKFTDEFEIVSKHQIYRIPVSAQIVSEETFQKMGLKEPKESLLKIGVSELKIQSNIRGSRLHNTGQFQLPKIDR